MGRLVRRYIRCYKLTVKHGVVVDKDVKVSVTDNLYGNHIDMGVEAGITLTGNMFGDYIGLALTATSEVTGFFEGIRIEQYVPSGATLGSSVYGIHICNFLQVDPDGQYVLIRASEHGSATVDNCIYIHIGDNADANYFLALMGATKTAWAIAGSKTALGASGWLRCYVGGKEKFIQLYG